MGFVNRDRSVNDRGLDSFFFDDWLDSFVDMLDIVNKISYEN